MLDGFLEILNSGKAAIAGECTDAIFGKKHAMSITDFELSSNSEAAAKKKKKKGANGEEVDDDDDEEGGGGGTVPPSPGLSSTAGKLLGSWNNLGAAATAPKKRKFSMTFEVSKEIDVASPELFVAYCNNAANENVKPFDTAKVTLRKASGKNQLVYLVFEFTHIHVATYELESGGGDKPPKEKISFTFNTMSMQYRPQKAPGLAPTKITSWDFETPPAS